MRDGRACGVGRTGRRAVLDGVDGAGGETGDGAVKRLATAALLACMPMIAQTTITDTLYYADGRPANGRVEISWTAFTAAGGAPIAAGRTTVAVYNGVLTMALEPTVGATPSTTYLVRYRLANGAQYTERWNVPESAAPVSIAYIRELSPAAPAVPIALSQLGRGGASEGQCLVWAAAGWTPAACSGSANATQIQGRAVSAAAPTDGQALVWNAGSSTWQPGTVSGGSGEVNTASNAGISGTGVFDLKVDADLQFRRLNAISNRVSIALDAPNRKIDFDVAQENLAIAHTQVSGLGDAATKSSATAEWNAGQLQGRGVAAAAPADGQMLRWNATTSMWEPVKVRHSVTFAGATTVTVQGADHQLGTGDLVVTCYDAAAAVVEPGSVAIHPTTFDVTIQFAVAQDGKCVIR